ncbi:hypothetical protein LY625_12680 [Lysobacter sp. GX 14042]|uniref:hypothetical protein n=1 Tax=Lysobacter sp. GX 14042 TaxID=2907155 RepID=UPI001F465489|nr:hypothetical protein [Lysobacter sp. GX 14042]MCE7033456.1 hypothetical protein [Lysobacter sp. GX 14042]
MPGQEPPAPFFAEVQPSPLCSSRWASDGGRALELRRVGAVSHRLRAFSRSAARRSLIQARAVESSVLKTLQRQRKRLLQSYAIHVAWFSAMVITALNGSSRTTVAVAVLLALITVPPVIAYATAVHRTCRILDPRARTIGLVPMLVMTVLFTPFESGLIVPAKNLLVSGRLLRQARLAAQPPDGSEERPAAS